MPKYRKPVRKSKRSPILLVALIAGAVILLLTASGFAFAATQEQQDAFCASCHTQPETTYYQRSLESTPTDLASFHYQQKDVRCIDCHSGSGIFGRVGAEMLGAHNALAWYTNTATQPAKLTVPIGDVNCLKCHAQVTSDRTMNNHFHYFLSRWQSVDPNAAHCVTCHSSHTQDGTSADQFLNEQRTTNQCDACHRVLSD